MRASWLGVLDASECPPTFGTDPGQVVGPIAGGQVALTTAVEGAEDDEDAAVRDLDALGLTADDVVVGISASGRTPYVLSAIQEARRRSAKTVSVACNAGSAAGRLADIAIGVVVGPEFIAGSTRLKAGTAQKLVLNMIMQKKVHDRRRIRSARHQLRLAIARESRPPTTKLRKLT